MVQLQWFGKRQKSQLKSKRRGRAATFQILGTLGLQGVLEGRRDSKISVCKKVK